uniref:Uncharacterized protein n=1 Tax=Panagrolaimus sp. PS1159 TaxID=55785 RepID=A0AC35G0A5_9BILA
MTETKSVMFDKSDSGGLLPTDNNCESQPSRWSSVSYIDGERPIMMEDLNTPLAKSVSSLFRRNSEHLKEKVSKVFEFEVLINI